MTTQKNYYDRDDIIKCYQGELFGHTNRLPSPDMLMIDRVTHISDTGGEFGKGEIVAEMDIHPDLWFFKCHFIGDPVMPGCLGLDALWQLSGFFLAWKGHRGFGRALGVDTVRFSGQILPTARKVTYHVEFRRVMNQKIVLGISNGTVSVDNKKIYSAQNLRVGLFASLDQY